ncbi:MAG: macro domain-containing protein [Bacteroides sp.]|nr:macro domain-containing protein [Bacteroides sp.]
MIKEIKGNIFTTKKQTIVNTINCVGIMGAGVAYEFRLRYPDMYKKYIELCNNKMLNIGTLWIYKGDDKWVLNFPTKYHWKYESKTEYLEKGLQKFIDTYKEKGITSIAFPMLGASNGGIKEEVSLNIMKKYLEKCDIDIEIYHYDPLAYDDKFLHFKEIWDSISDKDLHTLSGIGISYIKKIREALKEDNIRSMSKLLTIKGIGDVTLEKSFRFIENYKNKQLNLLD